MRPSRLLLFAICLVALNLRAPLASLPPLVPTVQHDVGLSGAVAGLLTTLPVLCMGLFAPVSQRLANLIGRETTVGVAVLSILIGGLLRLAGAHASALIASSLFVGVGIALAGTVLPGIVKEHYAARSGLLTGLYLLSMMIGATAASALSVPLADWLGGWQRSLGLWSVLAVIGLLAWSPVMLAGLARRVDRVPEPKVALPWRDRTAWLLAGFLSLQSIGFYSQLAWIAPSYEDRGWTARDAGLLLAVYTTVQLFSGLGFPALADRFPDRRPLLAAAVICCALGLGGVWLRPDSVPVLWVAMMGVGQGGGFAICLVKLVDYAPSPAASARLTAMAFLVSYAAASVGPVMFGALHDATGDFDLSYAVLAVAALIQLAFVPSLRPGRSTEPPSIAPTEPGRAGARQ